MNLLSNRILQFYQDVHFERKLPDGIEIMNPYRESEDIRQICAQFYIKYYNDNQKRSLILGINPGRLGAGATGLPFTDTKRLNDDCGIFYDSFSSHEPSSVFVYEVIKAFGGPEKFYKSFYISSVCPLGFIKKNNLGRMVNFNYYDSKTLEDAMLEFIHDNIRKQIELAGRHDFCLCFGTGKNFKFLSKLNEKHHYFEEIIPLEHPRYIMQYKSKMKEEYIDAYLQAFDKALK